ncbi:hypothetical protein D3C83_108190 [compost metagenome]
MPAHAGIVFVGPMDHRHRIPADQAFDAAFDFQIARIMRLLVERNGVDVRRVRGERLLDALASGMIAKLAEQTVHAGRAPGLEHVIERL